eukprot:6147955-Lingulodinium_polyedra.AAC.1
MALAHPLDDVPEKSKWGQPLLFCARSHGPACERVASSGVGRRHRQRVAVGQHRGGGFPREEGRHQ